MSKGLTKKERFLDALAEAYRLQEAVINAIDLCIISVKSDGTITSFNKAAENLLGYGATEVMGIVTPLIFHDLQEVIIRADELSKESGRPVDPGFDVLVQGLDKKREWTYVPKDGKRFRVFLSAWALKDESDRQHGFVFIAEPKAKPVNVKEEGRTFREISENIPGIIYLANTVKDNSLVYINHKVEELTGYTRDEFLSGKIRISQLIHPEDRGNVMKAIDHALVFRKNFHLFYRMTHRSGALRWMEEYGTGVYTQDHQILLEGFITDITEKKLAEDQLIQVASECHRVFNHAGQLNAVIDFEGNLKRVNHWDNITGWGEKDLMGKKVYDVLMPSDREKMEKTILGFFNKSEPMTLENRLVCANGSTRWVLWSLSPDEGKKVVYASAVDISERKYAEDKLLHAGTSQEQNMKKLQQQKLHLEEFARTLSHNLRSPAINIQALISMVHDQSSIDEYKDIFSKLKIVAENLQDTLGQIMDALQINDEASKELTEVSFKEIWEKTFQSLQGEIIQCGAKVTCDFAQADKMSYSKPYMESIFLNLMSNAIKYRDPSRSPVVHFETSVAYGKMVLRVSDNGLGIDMAKYGDSLFKLHKTFHNVPGARGVGLFLTRTQIEALGGAIKVESQVGQGSTFIIVF